MASSCPRQRHCVWTWWVEEVRLMPSQPPLRRGLAWRLEHPGPDSVDQDSLQFSIILWIDVDVTTNGWMEPFRGISNSFRHKQHGCDAVPFGYFGAYFCPRPPHAPTPCRPHNQLPRQVESASGRQRFMMRLEMEFMTHALCCCGEGMSRTRSVHCWTAAGMVGWAPPHG